MIEHPPRQSGAKLGVVPDHLFEGKPCPHGVNARTQYAWRKRPHNNPPPRVRVYTVPRALYVDMDDDVLIVCADCFLADLKTVLGAL